ARAVARLDRGHADRRHAHVAARGLGRDRDVRGRAPLELRAGVRRGHVDDAVPAPESGHDEERRERTHPRPRSTPRAGGSRAPAAVRMAADTVSIPDALPVLPLRDAVVFPEMAAPVLVGQPRSLALVNDALRGSRLVAVVAQKSPDTVPPRPDDLF